MRARLRAGDSTDTRLLASATAVVAVLILAMWTGISRWFYETPMRMALGCAGLACIGAAPLLREQIRVNAALRDGRFTRFRGRFVLRRYNQPVLGRHGWDTRRERRITWAVTLPSAEIIVPDALAALLRDIGSGEIDYSPETRLILEVRDQAGGPVYRGYNP